MYDRGKRFKTIDSCTPENLGPNTYYLSDTFDYATFNLAAPFNSTELRNTVFINKNIAENPSPNKYRIRFRKRRIIGGTSLQNKAQRLNYKVKPPKRRFTSTREAKLLPGKVFVGVPPRSENNKVSTIPEKSCAGYDITDHGLLKISNPPQNRHISPAEYYNPQAGVNYATDTYKGTFWSLRSARRFSRDMEEGEGPGPANYSVGRREPSAWEQSQQLERSLRQAQAPLLRTGDLLQRRLCTEGLPGPGAYSPFDPNTQKCECGKLGTFSKSKRQTLYPVLEGPGPAAYTHPGTASKATFTQAPFGVDAHRFPKSLGNNLPGPNEYTPKGSLWDRVQRRAEFKFGQRSAPFQSSAARDMALARADAGCMPAPDRYSPKFQKKGDDKISSMFAGNPCKIDKKAQDMPGPAAYSILEPFNFVANKKSHLKNSNSAFLSASKRIQPLRRSSSPGPTTYDLPNSTLNKKGCVISVTLDKSLPQCTPGPPHYQIHPKYARSAVFDTHNVTLGPKETLMKRCRKTKNTGEKRLRCFTTKRCQTNPNC